MQLFSAFGNVQIAYDLVTAMKEATPQTRIATTDRIAISLESGLVRPPRIAEQRIPWAAFRLL